MLKHNSERLELRKINKLRRTLDTQVIDNRINFSDTVIRPSTFIPQQGGSVDCKDLKKILTGLGVAGLISAGGVTLPASPVAGATG